MSDPMEGLVSQALTNAGIGFTSDYGGENKSGLDFRLENGVEIEVKRFHSPRIAEQMSRAENVIALQGQDAVSHYADLHNTIQSLTAKLERAKMIADKLLCQIDEPLGNDIDRVHYWRDKAIHAARDLLTAHPLPETDEP